MGAGLLLSAPRVCESLGRGGDPAAGSLRLVGQGVGMVRLAARIALSPSCYRGGESGDDHDDEGQRDQGDREDPSSDEGSHESNHDQYETDEVEPHGLCVPERPLTKPCTICALPTTLTQRACLPAR